MVGAILYGCPGRPGQIFKGNQASARLWRKSCPYKSQLRPVNNGSNSKKPFHSPFSGLERLARLSMPGKAGRVLILAALVFNLLWAGLDGTALAGTAGSELLITDARLRSPEGFLEEQVQEFLNRQPGLLKTYQETLFSGETQSAARSIVAYSLTAEINPKVVLVFLELKSGLLSNAKATPGQVEAALGFDKPDQKGFRKQLNLLTGLLSDRWSAYDLKSTLQFKDGASIPANPALNRGTYAVQAALALTTDKATWEKQAGTGDGSFYALYKSMFEDPLTPQPRPAGLKSVEPFLRRPFDEADLQGQGEVAGWGRNINDPSQPASDHLNYDSPADYGVNTYFDHKYPFSFNYPQGNLPDNEAPDVVVTYRGTETPQSWGAERAYSGHNGIDFNLPAGKPVLAAAAGKVLAAGMGDCGLTLVIDHHNGYKTSYLHLDTQVLVAVGQEVREGQPVARVGHYNCTIPHLHFSVQNEHSYYVDPFGFCPGPVAADPWEVRSGGVKSYWLWKNLASPCRQQNGQAFDYAPQLAYPGFSNLTKGRDGAEGANGPPEVLQARPAFDLTFSPELDALVKLAETDPETRQQAIAANLDLLENEDPLLREGAIATLVKLKASEAIPKLLKHLDDQDGAVRDGARQALVKLGAQDQTVTAYLGMLDKGGSEARGWAAYGLGKLGANQAVPKLLERLADSDSGVRCWAITALGDLGATQALPRLVEIAAQSDGCVQASAAQAIESLKSKV